jgi:hypothetical protein
MKCNNLLEIKMIQNLIRPDDNCKSHPHPNIIERSKLEILHLVLFEEHFFKVDMGQERQRL